MNTPLTSILIPCYNAQQWFAETIESALAQTWKNKEIIVVDDGSTDESLSIARAYESLGVKVISQTNQGASAARNHALQLAQGDFIQYLDADDLLAPDKIERQIALLAEIPEGAIASGEWARFYGDSHHESVFQTQPLWTDLDPVDWLVCAWEGHWMMHPAAWLIPRVIAQKAGVWNENLSLNDDGEYFCRVILASRCIKFCPDARSFYRSGLNNSLSRAKSLSAWRSCFHTLESDTEHILAVEDSPRTRLACANRFQRFIYDTYPNFPILLKKAETNIEKMGGADIQPTGGSLFKIAIFFLGWKKAKKLQRLVYKGGYKKLALSHRLSQLIREN